MTKYNPEEVCPSRRISPQDFGIPTMVSARLVLSTLTQFLHELP